MTMQDLKDLKVETIIRLNKFKPRSYQIPICHAIASEGGKYRKLLCVLPRRAGKDVLMWNLMIRAALKEVGNYFYCLPTFAQARSVIWDSITNTGEKFLDFIPPELIAKIRNDTMQIVLANGSQIKLIGSDSYDTSIIGTNPKMIVFSEYALADENAYKLAAMPILRANNGIVCLISTPRGKNHMYELFQIAKHTPEWFTYFKSIEDTGHISIEEIKKDIASGEISEDMARQEYWCSFDMGQEGALYAKYIDKMRLKGQIGTVPWEPYHKVYTSWDLGIADPTCIIFFQVIGEIVRVIDYYEQSDRAMDHFARIVLEKPYVYATNGHFPPHDIMARESARGLTKREMYKELGIKFTEPVLIDIEDGIELVRRTFSKMWIDEKNCKQLIKALENYRYEWDERIKRYKSRPLHDWSSHACFTGDTKILTRHGMRQIMDIQENDEVLTLSGWQKCTKAQLTIKDANLVVVTFTDGTRVRCTPDHLFLTSTDKKEKWKSAESLQKGTEILSGWMFSPIILTGHSIEYGLTSAIFLKEGQGFIEMYGKVLLEKSHKAVIYITETMMSLITSYGTWSVSHPESILECLNQIAKDFLKNVDEKLLNGMVQKLEDCGTNGMPKNLWHIPNGREKRKIASIVRKNLIALYAKMGINKNFVTRIAKLPIIESVEFLNEKADVWDITVPSSGQFCLSNGAIVHNSDSMRYLCAALPKTRTGANAEELEKRYQDAMYGHNSRMPSVFRDDLPNY